MADIRVGPFGPFRWIETVVNLRRGGILASEVRPAKGVLDGIGHAATSIRMLTWRADRFGGL